MDFSVSIFWGSHIVLAKVSSFGLPMKVVPFLFMQVIGLAREDVSYGSRVVDPLYFSGFLTTISKATFEVEIWEVDYLIHKDIVLSLHGVSCYCFFHFFTLSFLLFFVWGEFRGSVPLELFEVTSLWVAMNVSIFFGCFASFPPISWLLPQHLWFSLVLPIVVALSSLEVMMDGLVDDLSSIEVEVDVAVDAWKCYQGADVVLTSSQSGKEIGLSTDFFPSSLIQVERLEGMIFSILLILNLKAMGALLKPIIMVMGAWKTPMVRVI